MTKSVCFSSNYILFFIFKLTNNSVHKCCPAFSESGLLVEKPSSSEACHESGIDSFEKPVDSDIEMDMDGFVGGTEYSDENLSDSENTKENNDRLDSVKSNKKRRILKSSKKSNLSGHKLKEQSSEKGKKLFLCSVCSEQCDSLIKLQMHFKLNHKASTLSFQCYLCETSFSTYGNLNKHINSVHFMKKYFCNLCDKSYKRNESLTFHKTKAHSYMIEERWKCKWCDQQFTRFADYKNHCGGKFVCEKEDCIKLFNCRHGLTEHMNKEHGFPCDICGKVCNSNKHLYDHKRDHSKQLPCPICGKLFAYQSRLDFHLNAHKHKHKWSTGNKPFKCETCGMSFIRLKILQSHVRQKHREPKFRCTVCDKKIFYKGHLEKHMKSHLDDKTFNCSICNATFSDNNSLTSHYENVHTIHVQVDNDKCNENTRVTFVSASDCLTSDIK